VTLAVVAVVCVVPLALGAFAWDAYRRHLARDRGMRAGLLEEVPVLRERVAQLGRDVETLRITAGTRR